MIISACSPAQQRKGVAAQGKGLADPFLPFIGQKGLVRARASAALLSPPLPQKRAAGLTFLDWRQPQRPNFATASNPRPAQRSDTTSLRPSVYVINQKSAHVLKDSISAATATPTSLFASPRHVAIQSTMAATMFPARAASSFLPRLSSPTFASVYTRSLALPLLPKITLSIPAISLNLPSLPSLEDIWDGLLKAVPKKKVSHSKKRHRQMAGKALKDVTSLCRCPSCGQVKRMHILCPTCLQRRSSHFCESRCGVIC